MKKNLRDPNMQQHGLVAICRCLQRLLKHVDQVGIQQLLSNHWPLLCEAKAKNH